MYMKRFLSGDEAFADGVRLARPQVISAYPITPQTVVVERLSEMVEEGQLAAEYVHVESEHSALSCAIGASATGARTFTATSSHSLALLDHGWVQAYAQDNQEALDLALMAYAVAEDPEVRTPFMVNLDGFALTHTYESVDIPDQEQADAFLPPYDGAGTRFDFANPVNIGYSAGPEFNRYFKHSAHEGMLAAADAVERVEAHFAEVFGRSYPGLIAPVDCDDADIVLVTLGSIAGLARERVAQLRAQGVKAGLVRIRYMRPFPARQIVEALAGTAAVGVLEKDVSFGAEGTVMTNVCSALQQAGNAVPVVNFVGGLGGDDITQAQMRGMFEVLEQIAAGRIAPDDCPRVGFLGVDSVADEFGNPCCEGCGDAGVVAVADGDLEGVRGGACATDAEGGR